MSSHVARGQLGATTITTSESPDGESESNESQHGVSTDMHY